MADPTKLAAALGYLSRLDETMKGFGAGAKQFGAGVVDNLAGRAKDLGSLIYEAGTSDPNMGRMNTAEFSQAAAQRPQTPNLDQMWNDLGNMGQAIVTQPVETGKAIVKGEVQRIKDAFSDPRAAGNYAGSFIDPMRLAKALHNVPTLKMSPDEVYKKMLQNYGPFAQAINIGVKDKPKYRQMFDEITANKSLSDEELKDAFKQHPDWIKTNAGYTSENLRKKGKNGAANMVEFFAEQNIPASVELSNSLGSNSVYVTAKIGDKPVKIRISDHLPTESSQGYSPPDIYTTPQHWKAAANKALKQNAQ